MGQVLTPQRILIAGAWRWPMYEAAFARGLGECGVTVSRVILSGREGWRGSLARFTRWSRTDHRLLLEMAEVEQPDWVLLWRPIDIDVATVAALQARGIRVATYHNDDPLNPRASSSHAQLWSRYRSLLPQADHHFVYRPVNLAEARSAGARHVDLLPPYFLPWRDRPVVLDDADRERFAADVVFVGHYESDGRVSLIRALVAAGLKVRVWSGAEWDRRALGDAAAAIGPIRPALDDDYARAICGGAVALGLLSAANRDVYTRRCLEIPACGGVLLAPRTEALQTWFRDGDEACLFSSQDEAVELAVALSRDAARRARIAEAGRRRVWADGHDVTSRARDWLQTLALSGTGGAA